MGINLALTSESVRVMADRVVGKNPTLRKDHVLELLAHAAGFKNFDTLSGVLAKSGKSADAGSFAFPHLANARTLYVEGFSCSEHGEGPAWVRVELTPDFLAKVQKLAMSVVRGQGLEYAVVSYAPTDWDDEDSSGRSFHLGDWRLYVSRDDFWFRGVPKHRDYAVESRAVPMSVLAELLKGGSERRTDFLLSGDAIFYDGGSAEGLMAEVLERRLAGRSDDIAEWMGLHYRVNFDAVTAPGELLQWIDRYDEANSEFSEYAE